MEPRPGWDSRHNFAILWCDAHRLPIPGMTIALRTLGSLLLATKKRTCAEMPLFAVSECSASIKYMELVLVRISRKAAFSAKVGFSMPEAVLWKLVLAETVGTALQSFCVTPVDCQYKAYL